MQLISLQSDYPGQKCAAIREINDAHLKAIEKVTLQPKKLDHVSAGLKKLATEMSPEDQAKFLFNYVKNVKRAIGELEGDSNED